MADYKTKQPTGLSITRKGKKLTIAWKIGDSDYKQGQQIASQITTKKKEKVPIFKKVPVLDSKGKVKRDKKGQVVWRSELAEVKTVTETIVGKQNTENVSVAATARTYTIDISKYFPNTNKYLTHIDYWVRGKRAVFESNDIYYYPQWSAWPKKTFTISAPSDPKVSASWNSTNENETLFTWECPDKDTSHKWFYDYEVQTVLKENCNVAKGTDISWNDATTTTGKTVSRRISETVPFSGNYSYTRWLRVRCRGPRGLSGWIYAKHVYAMPPIPKDTRASADKYSQRQGYLVSVKWEAPESNAHPIDNNIVEYTVGVPKTKARTSVVKNGVTWSHTELLPFDFPSSGTTASTPKDTNGKDGVTFPVVPDVSKDECIIVRVSTKHDNKTSHSIPVYTSNSFAKLSDPSDLVVDSPDDTGRFHVSVTDNSAVDNTFVAIYCRLSDDLSNPKCIGVIPKGSQQPLTCYLPEMDDDVDYSIGARTFLADYSPITPEAQGVTYYQISNQLMFSDTVWDDRPVPKPPKNVLLTNPRIGVIHVDWDWSWLEATGAELSWSKDEFAWNSTSQPSTYTVENTHNGSWDIGGLDIGTWYVRVRLFRQVGENVTYGSYSKTSEIKISSAPLTPALTLNPTVITDTGETICTWVYATGDGTGQANAIVAEAYPQFEEVESPSPSVNPRTSGYHERGREFDNGHYIYTLSSDTEVDPEKTYYTSLGTWEYNPIEQTYSMEHLTVYAEKQDWKSGETHYLALSYTSTSGESSRDWSDPQPLVIADSPTVEITSTSLVDRHIPLDDYALSTDTEVVSGKTYYSRSGSGTDDDPYIYTEIESPTPSGNPSEQSYYEMMYDDYKALVMMPLTVNVTGAGEVGETTVSITRRDSYHIERPNGSERDGFEGETIAILSQTGEAPITIDKDDLLGYFDDGAWYELIATVVDSYGQSVDTSDAPIEFKIEWDHQAVVPKAEIEVFEDNLYATILPSISEEYELSRDTEIDQSKTYYSRTGSGTDEDPYEYIVISEPYGSPLENGYYEAYDSSKDRCDIYRLSADPPALIYSNAKIGTKYVDPHPTLGRFGGYRVVYVTENGDYITSDNHLAWADYNSPGHQLNIFATVIDFAEDRVILPYNISVSNKWSKDFTETKYLGGSVQGDWNLGVSRTATVSSTTVVEENPETIMAMRKLATYAGICHIRTPEGSSYSANVEVSEDREEKWVSRLAKFSLNITRVDPEEDEAMEYSKWIGE